MRARRGSDIAAAGLSPPSADEDEVPEERPHGGYAARQRRRGEPARTHLREPTLEVLDRGVSDVPAETVAREERSRRYASTVRGERCAARRERKRSTSRSGAERTRRASWIRWASARSSRANLGSLPLRVAVPAAGAVAALLVAAFPAPAQATQLIARDTSTERLAVARDGKGTDHVPRARQSSNGCWRGVP